MRGWWALLVLAGCGEVEPPSVGRIGQLRLCLITDDAAAAPSEGDDVTAVWTVEGTVAAPTDAALAAGPIPCWSDLGRTLDVVTEGGARWRLGWYASEGEVDRTPATGLVEGTAVRLTLRHRQDWAAEVGVVVRSDEGVVLAAEEGWYDDADLVAPTDADGLVVHRGERDDRLFYEQECGRFAADRMVFQGDGEPVTLQVWEEGTVVVGGRTLQARTPGAWSFTGQVTCTDTWGPAPWIVWRD